MLQMSDCVKKLRKEQTNSKKMLGHVFKLLTWNHYTPLMCKTTIINTQYTWLALTFLSVNSCIVLSSKPNNNLLYIKQKARNPSEGGAAGNIDIMLLQIV